MLRFSFKLLFDQKVEHRCSLRRSTALLLAKGTSLWIVWLEKVFCSSQGQLVTKSILIVKKFHQTRGIYSSDSDVSLEVHSNGLWPSIRLKQGRKCIYALNQFCLRSDYRLVVCWINNFWRLFNNFETPNQGRRAWITTLGEIVFIKFSFLTLADV